MGPIPALSPWLIEAHNVNIITSHERHRDLADVMPAAPSALLSLPAELRNKIYAYLLQPGATLGVEHETIHGLSPAILQVCRQTYREGYSIFRQNRFVKLFYSGSSDCAPQHGFARARAVDFDTMRSAGSTICTFRVNVRRAQAGSVQDSLAIMTLKAFATYIGYLYARQIVWMPSTIVPQPILESVGEVWWVHIDLVVTFPSASSSTHDRTDEKYRSILLSEENAVCDLVRDYQHPDNTLSIVPRALSWTASTASMSGPAPWRRLFDWIPHVLRISIARKDVIDTFHRANVDASAVTLQYIASEYRSLCLDLQFFIECCELTHVDSNTEALGEYRGPVFTLLCSTFHDYAYMHARYDTLHPEYWPFQRSCPVDICACHSLIQTDADIAAERPTPDLDIPITLWHRMQHLTILIHYLCNRSQKAAEWALRKLQVLASMRPVDPYLDHDKSIFLQILRRDVDGKGERRLSLFTLPARISRGDGVMCID